MKYSGSTLTKEIYILQVQNESLSLKLQEEIDSREDILQRYETYLINFNSSLQYTVCTCTIDMLYKDFLIMIYMHMYTEQPIMLTKLLLNDYKNMRFKNLLK